MEINCSFQEVRVRGKAVTVIRQSFRRVVGILRQFEHYDQQEVICLSVRGRDKRSRIRRFRFEPGDSVVINDAFKLFEAKVAIMPKSLTVLS